MLSCLPLIKVRYCGTAHKRMDSLCIFQVQQLIVQLPALDLGVLGITQSCFQLALVVDSSVRLQSESKTKIRNDPALAKLWPEVGLASVTLERVSANSSSSFVFCDSTKSEVCSFNQSGSLLYFHLL